MNKPTDDGPAPHELLAIIEHADENNLEPDVELYLAGKAAGIAHGWRECIEALRACREARGPVYVDPDLTVYLEQLAKERGHG